MREGFRNQHYGCSKNQMANGQLGSQQSPASTSGTAFVLQQVETWTLNREYLRGGESQERNGHGSADGARYLELGCFRITYGF